MFLRLSIATLLTISATAAFAGQKVYDCSVKNTRLNWIPERIIIAHNDGAGSAMVNDPIINNYIGKPVSAKVTKNNDKIVAFRWRITVKDKTNQRATMTYQVSIKHDTGKISVTAKPAGYSNLFSSGGTCKTS